MCDLYKRIYDLCQRKGISIGKMCAELNISRGNLTELKMGRIKTLKADNLTKISTFFGVTIDYLLTGLPANIYECPNDENPWEVELLDAFDQLDIDHQIAAVEHVQNMVAFNDDSVDFNPFKNDRVRVDETNRAPTENGERDILDEVDVAFYGDFKELDEDERETVRDMVRLMRQRKEKRSQ